MILVEIMENIQVIMLDILMYLTNFVVYLHSAFDYSWEIGICLCVCVYIYTHFCLYLFSKSGFLLPLLEV